MYKKYFRKKIASDTRADYVSKPVCAKRATQSRKEREKEPRNHTLMGRVFVRFAVGRYQVRSRIERTGRNCVIFRDNVEEIDGRTDVRTQYQTWRVRSERTASI